ncbi:MAG: proline--tRNA ligase, partial [Gammaproteobacteria bacterium PRO9]|nr:proline--tRNA ligase [Gammaproteobacteria bacterium PRO9]
QCVKTLVVEGDDGKLVALLLRGDHELNPVKAARAPGVARPLRLATPEQVHAAVGAPVGALGPVGLDLPVVADHAVLALADFICGANAADTHLTGVNWQRDLPVPAALDLRNVVDGDPSPGGGGTLTLARGIEVGHIFQLGEKYASSMRAVVLDQDGKERVMTMGCYGIGVSRVVGAAIEQNHDEHGILWPEPMSPFDVILVELNPKKSASVTAAVDGLYNDLQAAGLEVLLDDRDARPGVKFADADLVGIPHRLVVGERGLAAGKVEYRHRQSGNEEQLGLSDVVEFLQARRGLPRQG